MRVGLNNSSLNVPWHDNCSMCEYTTLATMTVCCSDKAAYFFVRTSFENVSTPAASNLATPWRIQQLTRKPAGSLPVSLVLLELQHFRERLFTHYASSSPERPPNSCALGVTSTRYRPQLTAAAFLFLSPPQLAECWEQ